MTALGFTPRPLFDFKFSDVDGIQDCLLPSPVRQGRAPSWQVGHCYPSPPMSGPSSPTRSPRLTADPSLPSGDIRPSAKVSADPSLSRPLSEPALSAPASQSVNILAASTSQDLPTVTSHTASQTPIGFQTGSEPRPSSIETSLGGSRLGRRSKAHVANACGNCKRAHLSCDPQRPCQRCVASGKADSCRDVPHKKRGRPRLREDADFRAEVTAGPSVTLAPSVSSASTSSTVRPVAPARRHTRGDSLRSIQSFDSDVSMTSVASPTFSHSVYGRSWTSGRMVPPAQRFAVPVAFLDLDLVVQKANAAFQNLVAAGEEIRGRRLGDFARATDGDAFFAVRNDLLEEKRLRDPSYLPPILEQGHDPFQGVSEEDVDRVTRGFSDRQFFFTYSLPGGGEQTLASRVRLARTSIFFVSLTLAPIPQSAASSGSSRSRTTSTSTISPTHGYAPSFYNTPSFAEPYGPARSAFPQSAPPSPFYSPLHFPLPSTIFPAFQPQHQSQTTSPVRSSQGSIMSPPGGVGQPFATGNLIGSTDPYGSFVRSRRLSQQSIGSYQAPQTFATPTQTSGLQRLRSTSDLTTPRPPLFSATALSPPGSATASSSRHLPGAPPPQYLQEQRPLSRSGYGRSTQVRPRRDTLGRQLSSDPEEEADVEHPSQQSPRKRRRLDIEDVLQK